MKNSPKVKFFCPTQNSLNRNDDDEEREIILKMKAQSDKRDDKKK